MYTMHEVCEKTGLSYQTLKYYCREGLVPGEKAQLEESIDYVNYWIAFFDNVENGTEEYYSHMERQRQNEPGK